MQLSKRNTIKTLLALGAAAGGGLSLSGKAFAQAPITLYVGFPAGGIPDIAARALANRLSIILDRSIIVNNRTGAGGQLALQALKNARPDGTSYTFSTPASLTLLPHLQDVPYDVEEDLQAVAMVCSYFSAFAVNPDVPANTLSEFFEWCRQNPDQANVGVPGLGTTLHFMVDEMAAKANTPVQVVPYKGGPALSQAVVSGEIAASLNLSNNFTALYQADRLKLLGITSTERLDSYPDVPTFVEEGFEDIGVPEWMGVIANAQTPASEIDKMQAAVQSVVADESFQKEIDTIQCLALSMTTQEFSELINTASKHWANHIQTTGFKLS